MATNANQITGRNRRIYTGFGAVLLLLFGVVAIALASFGSLARATELNIHSYEVLGAAQEVRLAAVNIQTGYRGFVLTGDSAYLEPLQSGQTSFDASIALLLDLTADTPTQRPNIERAMAVEREWNEVHIIPGLAIRSTISDSTAEVAELIEQVNPQRGRIFLQNLEQILDEIRAVEIGLLEERRAAMAMQERRTTILLILGGLFGLIAATTFATIAARQSGHLMTTNQRLRQEIGERKRAEQSLGRLSRRNELLLAAAGEGICGLDAEGRITFLNPAAEAMLGWREEEIRGRGHHEALHPRLDDGETFPLSSCPIQASLVDGEVHEVENEVFWRKEGSSFPVEYISTPIVEDEQIVGVVVTFSDVTERRAVERIKGEFVSVVSHELRTPLTAIRGSLGLLASGVLGSLPEKGQRMLEIASQNTDRLVRLINDILDIERIESGKVIMEMEDAEVDALVRQAVEGLASLAEGAGVSVDIAPVEGRLYGDPDRLIQVLTNLIGNAIKFSEPGTRVEVGASYRPDEWLFTVSDQGRGIPADKLDSIFDRFQQVDASDSRKRGGTGLGLAIARTIVQQHGGRIWVESEEGQGSRFNFTVAGGSPATRAVSPSAPGILLRDDDELIREAVANRLRDRGYRVEMAGSGEEAIELAARTLPDLILLDMIMPGLDGYQTMIRLQENMRTREIPVVILSSSPRASWPAVGEGVEWVLKTGNADALFRALESALAQNGRIARILLVEDDLDLAEVLIETFKRPGVQVFHAESCSDAVEIAAEESPDLVILDLLLPDEDGFQLVHCFRDSDVLRSTPLMVYSAVDLTPQQKADLTLGPTEFFTKGRVRPEELEKRVTLVLDGLVGIGEENE